MAEARTVRAPVLPPALDLPPTPPTPEPTPDLLATPPTPEPTPPTPTPTPEPTPDLLATPPAPDLLAEPVIEETEETEETVIEGDGPFKVRHKENGGEFEVSAEYLAAYRHVLKVI